MNSSKKILKAGQISHLGLVLGPSKFGYSIDLSWYGKTRSASTLGPIPIGRNSKDTRYYTDEYYEDRLPDVLLNYEINMAHFKSLDNDEFLSMLDSLKNTVIKIKGRKYSFQQSSDLNEYSNYGDYLYIMILGEYKQVYIGKTYDVAKRVREHWVGNKPFDRLIWGRTTTSKLSIDSFRALDTTEVLVMDCSKGSTAWTAEEIITEMIPQKFVTNRMAGGEFKKGLIDAVKNRKDIELINE